MDNLRCVKSTILVETLKRQIDKLMSKCTVKIYSFLHVNIFYANGTPPIFKDKF